MKYLLFIIFGILASVCYTQNEIDPNTLTLAGGEQASVFTNLSLNEVALLDLESASGNLNLEFSYTAVNIEAGEAIIPAGGSSNSELWLNYTSAVPIGQSRTIGVNIDTALPAGLVLTVEAANYTGIGAGTHGTTVGVPVSLSTTNQNIITGIGGAFTGDGVDNGHNLNYTLSISDPSAIPTTGLSVEITYTLSAAL